MADLSLIKIWELNPVEWYDKTACPVPSELRDWLPVTHWDSEKGRVTVRAPYPVGDYDIYNALPDEDKECITCQGTGLVNGETCTTCHGTGVCADAGAITVEDSGVIHLKIDDTTLGIKADGRLFAKLKLKENSGLAQDENDAVYVNVDDKTIKIDENGQLYAVTVAPYSNKVTKLGVDPTTAIRLFTVTNPNVSRVKLHIDVDIKSTHYDTAIEMTRFSLTVGDDTKLYCWDKTVPYTMINYDTMVDIDTVPKQINMKLKPVTGDNFNDSAIMVNANIISC